MKIIRSVCFFTKDPQAKEGRLGELADHLHAKGYTIQTKRICTTGMDIGDLESAVTDKNILLSIGMLPVEKYKNISSDFINSDRTSCCVDMTDAQIDASHVSLLTDIIAKKPQNTFQFAFVFNNPPHSPFFPSADYKQEGFSIGLQSTDLGKGCATQDEWFKSQSDVWSELVELIGGEPDFLGIDSSVAPLFQGSSSLVNLARKYTGSFDASVLSDFYLKITNFIKNHNPKPVGLCGLMLPCLEDFELADEFSHGNFPLERNLFLSLHSGLGIDTYPIGIDENPQRIMDVMKLVQGLSDKYKKPLSIRFVSDGKAKIGEMTDFRNQYLKDVVIRPL